MSRSVAAVEAHYHFGYAIRWQGDPAAKPIQVFDDGAHTYFQIRDEAPTPAIFAKHDGQMTPASLTRTGMYLIAQGISPVWTIMVKGGAHGTATNTDRAADAAALAVAASRPASGAATAAATPDETPAPAGPTMRHQARTLKGRIRQLLTRIHKLDGAIKVESRHPTVQAAEHNNAPVARWNIDVPFKVGSDQLSVKGERIMARLRTLATSAIKITLIPISTPSGSVKMNDALGRQRAKTVAAALKAAGVDDATITRQRNQHNGAFPHVRVAMVIPETGAQQ